MSSTAISLSVAILIIVTSVMNGFSAELIDKILGLNPHIKLYKMEKSVINMEEVKQKIKTLQNVKNVSLTLSGAGMILATNNSAGVFVRGIDKKDIIDNTEFNKTIIGEVDKFSGYKIIIGRDVARQIGAKIGDEISLIVPITTTTMFGVIPRQVSLKVLGFIKSNSQQFDNYMAIIPFNTTQKIFNIKENAGDVEITTNNPNNIEDLQNELLKIGKFYISNWKMENGSLLNALKIEADVMSLILGLFVIASMFSIFAVLRMMIKSKEREIAILKAHGLSNKQICKMFFLIGITISIIGLIFGNILGVSFTLNINSIKAFLESIFHTNLFDGSVYLLDHLPSRLIKKDLFYINIFSFIISLFFTYISIKRNTKIDITKTLRNN